MIERMVTEASKVRVTIWAGFVLMCLGMFMAILDIQVVATSLPTIQDALGISPDALAAVVVALMEVFTELSPCVICCAPRSIGQKMIFYHIGQSGCCASQQI